MSSICFAAGVFGVSQLGPSRLSRMDFSGGVDGLGGTESLLPYHVAHGQALLILIGLGNERQDALFERVKRRQRGQTSDGISQLQEPEVNVGRCLVSPWLWAWLLRCDDPC